MLRYVLILLFVLIMLPVLRGWLGAIARLLLNWSLGTSSSAAAGQRSPMASPPAAAGSTILHKDPVCGTYVSSDSGITQTVGG